MEELTRAGFLAHAGSQAMCRKIGDARRILRAAAERGRTALMVSGGKDSTVMAALALLELGEVQGFHIDSGAEHPDALEAISALRTMGLAVETIHPEYTIVKMLQMVGALGYGGNKKLAGEWHWADGDYKRILIEEPAQRIRERGYPVALVGLRAEESRGRAMRMRRYGPIHERADGAIIACPLAWWSGADVMAFALSRQLPLGEIYLQEGAVPHERRRTGTMLGASGVRYGRWAELRINRPDLWQMLVEQFPRIRHWS